MKGYVRIYRKIEENAVVCKDNDYFRVWHYLIYNATHKEREVEFNGNKILLMPGQLVTGRNVLANKCKISESKAERILKRFKNEQQIEQQTCNSGRLITIVNWEKYQPKSEESEQQIEQRVNNEWTTTEQRVNTNNNDKNDNNVKNDKNISTLSISERDGNERNGDENLFEYVEKYFGRVLSPHEFEVIESWEDTPLTKYAIGQAVIRKALNVNYVERILEAYKEAGITTLEEAIERDKKFQEKRKLRVVDEKPTQIDKALLEYNWLDN